MKRPQHHRYPAVLVKGRSYLKSWIKNLHNDQLTYVVTVLAEASTKDELRDLEIYWIKQGFSFGWPLTNLVAGGEGSGHPPEHYARLSAQFSGVSRTPEVCAKIQRAALKRRGVPRSNEVRAKLSSAASKQFATKEGQLRTSRACGGRSFVTQTGQRFDTFREAAEALGLCASNICAVLHGRREQTQGFVFRYVDA